MLVSLAWRNLARNRRRSVLTGSAVAFAVLLVAWMLGMNEGGYAQMIRQAVTTRLGHLQVLPPGYLVNPEPALVLDRGNALATRLKTLPGVRALSSRVIAEGMLARDNEVCPVELLGVDPDAESEASVVAEKVLAGERARRWCRETLAEARDFLGSDDLFNQWCDAVGESEFLPADNERAVVLGVGVAERLLVSVGDEVTVQVVRAVDNPDGLGGDRAGDLSQRRLVVTGLYRTGQGEMDNRVVYVRQQTLMDMLGTAEPHEIVLLLDNIRDLDQVRETAAAVVAEHGAGQVHSWDERNPSLANLIEMDAGNGNVMYFVLCLLVTLGVINATMMSVLERTKEFGVVLALGARRRHIFGLIMTEVALLGALSVAVGAVLGAGIEIFGRLHGWKMEWFGYDAETLQNLSVSGVSYEAVYYAALSPEGAVGIVVGVYIMFLLAGVWPAIRAARLQPATAMRDQ